MIFFARLVKTASATVAAEMGSPVRIIENKVCGSHQYQNTARHTAGALRTALTTRSFSRLKGFFIFCILKIFLPRFGNIWQYGMTVGRSMVFRNSKLNSGSKSGCFGTRIRFGTTKSCSKVNLGRTYCRVRLTGRAVCGVEA